MRAWITMQNLIPNDKFFLHVYGGEWMVFIIFCHCVIPTQNKDIKSFQANAPLPKFGVSIFQGASLNETNYINLFTTGYLF